MVSSSTKLSSLSGVGFEAGESCPSCDGPLEGQSGSGDRSLGRDRGCCSEGAGPARYEGDGMCQRRRENSGLN